MSNHLKDRELERKLNELSGGEFSRILSEETDTKYGDCVSFVIHKNADIELSVFIRPEAIEIEYNPHGWNNFPEVTPPEGELMRVELFNLMLRKITRACAIYCNETWYAELNGEPNGTLELAGMTKVKRFRPWED